jgi:hypothetical protein
VAQKLCSFCALSRSVVPPICSVKRANMLVRAESGLVSSCPGCVETEARTPSINYRKLHTKYPGRGYEYELVVQASRSETRVPSRWHVAGCWWRVFPSQSAQPSDCMQHSMNIVVAVRHVAPSGALSPQQIMWLEHTPTNMDTRHTPKKQLLKLQRLAIIMPENRI